MEISGAGPLIMNVLEEEDDAGVGLTAPADFWKIQ